jgi:H/ACA ribonucleoprotein complex subunit 3
MLKCVRCGKYTLSENCFMCKAKTSVAQPPKFSAGDKYGKYRRMARVKKDENTD